MRPRRDFRQQAADAHARNVARRNADARNQTVENPVEPIEFRAARATGRAEHRFAVEPPQHQQIARIDRHADTLDVTAGSPDGGRNDVVGVADGRRAEDEDEIVGCGKVADRPSHLFDRVASAQFPGDLALRSRQTHLRDARRLVEHLVLDVGKHCLDHADTVRTERMHGKCGRFAGQTHRFFDQRRRDSEWDNLDGRHHLPFFNARMLGEGRKRHRSVYAVDRVDQRFVHDEDTRRGGVQIDPARRGILDLDVGRAESGGDFLRCIVFRQIVLRQNGCRHLFDARFAQERDVIARQAVRLAQAGRSRNRRMRKHGAFGIFDRDRAELHAALPFACCSPRERSAWMISARTATAISSGLAAPMFKPIGA